ncbi:MAG: heat shock protein HspQ, partial [Hyphomicrobiaceae bacterium]
MTKIRDAKYKVGDVVQHRIYPFRGIVFDIDPVFDSTEDWWESIPA